MAFLSGSLAKGKGNLMAFMQYFRRNRKKTAMVAKDRLQIIVARERGPNGKRDWLPLLHQELLQVISKYEEIDHEKVTVNLEKSGDCEVLELNIVLPDPTEEEDEAAAAKVAAPLPRSTRSMRARSYIRR